MANKFRESPHYREAISRCMKQEKARTPLGRTWHHLQWKAAVLAMIGEKKPWT